MNRVNSRALLEWYDRVKRDLPWRLSKDPYVIWVSEIILQQTRVDKGLPYFERFIRRFPDIKSLAASNEDDVLKLWEGLGYYSRARNMRSAAHQLVQKHGGAFPSAFEDILALKGIGPYTAAAISSIAFNIPEPSLDGNVLRVMSRFLADSNSIDEIQTKRRIEAFLSDKVPVDRPGDFNQAMMELGATICLPKSVDCKACPLENDCKAFRTGNCLNLPVRTKKAKKRDRYLLYLIPDKDGKTTVSRRLAGDIWEGLYQFPLVEVADLNAFSNPLESLFDFGLLARKDVVKRVSNPVKHMLSHQNLLAVFVHAEVNKLETRSDFIICTFDEVSNFAMPRLITKYMENSTC